MGLVHLSSCLPSPPIPPPSSPNLLQVVQRQVDVLALPLQQLRALGRHARRQRRLRGSVGRLLLRVL